MSSQNPSSSSDHPPPPPPAVKPRHGRPPLPPGRLRRLSRYNFWFREYKFLPSVGACAFEKERLRDHDLRCSLPLCCAYDNPSTVLSLSHHQNPNPNQSNPIDSDPRTDTIGPQNFRLRMPPHPDDTMLDLRLTLQTPDPVRTGSSKRPREEDASSTTDDDSNRKWPPHSRPWGGGSSGAGPSTGGVVSGDGNGGSDGAATSGESNSEGDMSPFSCGGCDKRFFSVFAIMDHIQMRPLHLAKTFVRHVLRMDSASRDLQDMKMKILKKYHL